MPGSQRRPDNRAWATGLASGGWLKLILLSVSQESPKVAVWGADRPFEHLPTCHELHRRPNLPPKPTRVLTMTTVPREPPGPASTCDINIARSGNCPRIMWNDCMGTGGFATPNRAGVCGMFCGRPPTNRPLLAVREDDGGVYSPSLRSRAVRLPPTPCRVYFRPCVFNKFSHFWQNKNKNERCARSK